MKYHFTLARMAILKKAVTRVGQEHVGTLEPHTLLMGCYKVQPLCKTVWLLLKKLNMKLPYDPTILS